MAEQKVLNHVAIIMDGNGRWAKQKGLPRNFGHKKGMTVVEDIIAHASECGVKALTLFTFSTENWSRPQGEIRFLFNALKGYLKKKKKKLLDDGVRFHVLGRRDGLPADLLSQLDEIERDTKLNKNLLLTLAFNYGGRAEIVDACRRVAQEAVAGDLDIENLSEQQFAEFLYSPFIPDVDLLIRTSGELRISNFLLWRLAYSELYFTKTLWPDFTTKEFDKAIQEFRHRERRYGRV